jgi:hypothetical protein
MKFDRYYVRKLNHHPLTSSVDMYVNTKHHVCTHHFNSERNVIFVCNNPTISPHLAHHFDCKVETHWMSVAKHKSEVLQMDMVVLQNSFCSLKTKDQVWELHYFCPPALAVSYVRSSLLYGEIEE